MNKTPINPQNNVKNKKEKDYAIKLTPQLADGLRYISDRTKMTQIGILEKILNPIIEQAISYETFAMDCYNDRNITQIIFYGKSRLVSGSNDPDILDEPQLFVYMVKKSMEIEPKTAAKKESKVVA